MSSGIKVIGGLFVISLPVMLYLTAPRTPVPASRGPVALARPVATMAAAPDQVVVPVMADQRDLEANDSTREAGTSAQETRLPTGRDLQGYAADAGSDSNPLETGGYESRTAPDHDPVLPSRAGFPAGGAETSTRRIAIIGDAALDTSPVRGPASEPVAGATVAETQPVMAAGENEFLPTGITDEGAGTDSIAAVECPDALYMGGNAYGRAMLVKMGCPDR